MLLWRVLLITLSAVSCVSNEHSFSDKVSIDPITVSEEARRGETAFKQDGGVETFEKTLRIEWFSCTIGSQRPQLVLLNPNMEALSRESACQNPIAAEARVQGYNVLIINRPGQGQSSGPNRLGDEEAVLAARRLVEQKKTQGYDIQGLWAYGEGSVEAFRLAKQFPFRFLVIGDGIYDLEKTLKDTKDPVFKARLDSLQSELDRGSFVEDRSIAWDFAGLPKEIILYHNNKNLQVSPEQASAFKASLAASEYKVELFIVDSEGVGLPGPFHRGLAQKILLKLKTSTPNSH